MAEVTKIQWCDATFNPWVGCSKVNEGCKFCYAETMMDTRYHRVIWGPNGTRSRTKTWRDPIKWNREATAAGERRKVFCASLADVFEDFAGTIDKQKLHAGNVQDSLAPWRSDLFDLIDQCPALDFLLLTKRPENIGRMWKGDVLRENVWLGTSIANQRNADECIDRLTPWRRLVPCLFLSVEPQIGEISLARWLSPRPMIDWVIVGGESRQGHGEPRLFKHWWARRIVDECRDAGVACFVKQMGSNSDLPGLKDGHGGNWDEWPAELRVRQCPEAFYPQLV